MNSANDKPKSKNDFYHLKRLFNVKEASHYLGVSAGAVYKYVEWGMITFRRLPSIPTNKNTSVKTHGRIVFELEDLDNFVEQFSEKRVTGNKSKFQEKSLDNFN